MAYLFGRKTVGAIWRALCYVRILVVTLYISSWLFAVMAETLVQTNYYNMVSCEVTIFACISLYISTKVIIYLFLVERVLIATTYGVDRWHSRLYIFNMVLVLPYFGIFAAGIYFRGASIAPEGHCLIGIRTLAAISFLVYDVLISSWLTFLFVRELMSLTSFIQGPSKRNLREVTRRSLIGSVVALLLSTANFAMIMFFDGHQRDYFCIVSCTVDLTLNTIMIHWVTCGGKSTTISDIDINNSMEIGRRNTDGAQGYQQGHHAVEYRDRDCRPGDSQGDTMQLDSFIALSVDSYVEEYHRMRDSGHIESIKH
ncbi:hypothetical protein BGZ94_006263 [Podila epigama]|nr:hypothetical protein BGZ94_006263 [Podila epigama]